MTVVAFGLAALFDFCTTTRPNDSLSDGALVMVSSNQNVVTPLDAERGVSSKSHPHMIYSDQVLPNLVEKLVISVVPISLTLAIKPVVTAVDKMYDVPRMVVSKTGWPAYAGCLRNDKTIC